MAGRQHGSMAGWKDVRMRGQEAGGKEKDGERKKAKPHTTVPSRGFAPGKLPLDRPHQGAVMLNVTGISGESQENHAGVPILK